MKVKEKVAVQSHSIDKDVQLAEGEEGDQRCHGARHEILKF